MIKLMIDRGADIPVELLKKYDISVLPFTVNLDGNSITAGGDFDADEFYKMVESSENVPTTSQMSPEDMEAMFREIGKENRIIYISISANGSGINNTAHMIADSLKDEGFDITIVNSEMYTMAIGRPVLDAAEMAAAGASKDEVVDYLETTYKRDTAYFVVDDLTFLKKGGRIKATTMAISALLDIKPILMITDGLVEACRKVRGLKKAMASLVGYAEERMENPQENEVIVMDTGAPDKVEIVENLLRERVKPKKITHYKIGPVITSHAGPGLVGIYFKHKKPYTEYEK